MDNRAEGLLDRIRRYAMPHGTVPCRGTWLRQVGEMRFAPNRPWFPFEAEQWFDGDGIDFRWEARANMAPLLRATVTDAFQGGRGLLAARLLGFLPVARSHGPATDRAEAMRGLAELPWRPLAFRASRWVTWSMTASGRLQGTFNDRATRASIEFEVGDDGRVLGCFAPGRPRLVGRKAVETAWAGKLSDHVDFDQVRVPTSAEAAWILAEGPFTYWKAKVTDFKLLR